MQDVEADGDDETDVTGPRPRKWLHLRRESLKDIDEATARTLLAEHGRLVAHLARQYPIPARSHGPLDHADMLASGHVVLLQSWIAYDPTQGTKFSTFAAMNLRRTFASLVRECHARSVHAVQLQKSGLRVEAVQAPISLDEPGRGPGEDTTVGDQIALYAKHIEHKRADDMVSERQRAQWLRAQIDRVLTSREREVILAVLEGTSFADVSARFGVTRQRVDQIWAAVRDKLHAAAKAQGLLESSEDDPSDEMLSDGGETKASYHAPAATVRSILGEACAGKRRASPGHADVA